MTTAPRPGEPYCPKSVHSLRYGGFLETLHLFAEPASVVPVDRDLVVVQHEQVRGCFQNFKFGIHYLLEHSEPGDWLLMLQDDVVFSRQARAILEEGMQQHPQAGFLSIYTSPAMSKPTEPLGWHAANHNPSSPHHHGRGFWGALAMCFPRESAAAMVAHTKFTSHTDHRKVDVVVGNTLWELNLPRLVHNPSMADHIGAKSTIGRDKIKGTAWGRCGKGFKA